MGETTAISWCDSTFSPWVGCAKVSPGCQNCYALDYDKRVGGVPIGQRTDKTKPLLRWGPGAPRTRTSVAYWKQPLKWNRAAEKSGKRHRVFCGSLCDVFDAEAPEGALGDLLRLIDATPSLDWLLLTKRSGRLAEVRLDYGAWARNVWLGVTVENQEQAEKRIPLLLAQDVTVRFLSIEPQLGPVDLSAFMGGPYVALPGDAVERNYNAGISWVICGGESGPKARPFDLAWARSIVAQCMAAEVPCFVKQMGSSPIWLPDGEQWWKGPHVNHDGSPRFADRSGADPSEWPEDLRVRQFPVPR
jgi:protein gp37